MASHLTEVWLAVAANMPAARVMLRGLADRLQSRFTPRASAASKADVWRLAAVDPLMVSGRGRPRAPWGALSGVSEAHPPLLLSLQILCTIHLLVENVDGGDKLLDLFPDLMFTLLLQLGSSQGPEAPSPVLKTWRLTHTGTLPGEINPQRCSGGQAVRAARQWGWAGRGLWESLRRQWTPRVASTEGPSASPPGS